jgi:hypothetical protein
MSALSSGRGSVADGLQMFIPACLNLAFSVALMHRVKAVEPVANGFGLMRSNPGRGC